MAEARPPIDDKVYNKLMGIEGKIDYETLLYVPFTGWSL